MTSGAQTREGRFIEVGWGFHGVLIGSREFLTLRWMALEKVAIAGFVRCWLYLAAKALGVGPARHCLVLLYDSGQWHFTGGCEPPQAWIFVEELIVRVPAVSVLEPSDVAPGSSGMSQAGL
jgi:hypothetical protein